MNSCKLIPLLLFLLVTGPVRLLAQQSIPQLEETLRGTKDKTERITLALELSKLYVGKDNIKANNYAQHAYELSTETNNAKGKTLATFLLAESYARMGDMVKAREKFQRGLVLAKAANDPFLVIQAYRYMGRAAAKAGNMKEAFDMSEEAMNYLSKNIEAIQQNSQKEEAASLNKRAMLANENRKLEQEKAELVKALEQIKAEKEALNVERGQLTQKQQELVEEQTKTREELTMKKDSLSMMSSEKEKAEYLSRKRESMLRILSDKKKADSLMLAQEIQAQKLAIASADLEIQKNRNIQIILLGASGIILILAFAFYSRYRAKRKSANLLQEKNQLIEEERKRSDDLLLNILPGPIADELKTQGKAQARRYDKATVLFTDFKNFSHISEQLTPEELVDQLDTCFKAFDRIIEKYEMEKIKTIGDAYVAATGLSEKWTNPANVVKAALEMQDFLRDHRYRNMERGLPVFEARIGIHTGPVVAGVVGSKKFAYDIWGETVNVAARLEQSCEPGRINISETTYWEVKYDIECTYRGKVSVKNMEDIDMFYVEKPIYA